MMDRSDIFLCVSTNRNIYQNNNDITIIIYQEINHHKRELTERIWGTYDRDKDTGKKREWHCYF